MSTRVDTDFSRRIERVETLVQAIERSSDPGARSNAQELVQTVLDLHGEGLSRLLDLLAEAGPSGRQILDAMTGDELIGSLLLLHGLHPLDLESRVRQALDHIRPALHAHKGDVTLLSVEDGVVRLRMEGSCHGCPSSAMTLKQTIEEAVIAAAPDAIAIEVDGVVPPPTAPPAGFISIDQVLMNHGHGGSTPERTTIAGPHR